MLPLPFQHLQLLLMHQCLVPLCCCLQLLHCYGRVLTHVRHEALLLLLLLLLCEPARGEYSNRRIRVPQQAVPVVLVHGQLLLLLLLLHGPVRLVLRG
jgi:hypothetical protein